MPGCGRPFRTPTILARVNRDWWPKGLNIHVLHQNSPLTDPMGKGFNYAEAFKSLDLDAVIKDLHALMTDIAVLVAGGLRPLRAVFHSHGVAQRWHVSHPRRARRRRLRHAAVRAAE